MTSLLEIGCTINSYELLCKLESNKFNEKYPNVIDKKYNLIRDINEILYGLYKKT